IRASSMSFRPDRINYRVKLTDGAKVARDPKPLHVVRIPSTWTARVKGLPIHNTNRSREHEHGSRPDSQCSFLT
ncbi:MAG: hypothetical protein ACXWMI_03230, partial [Syntrophales bacterium]